MLPFCSIWTLSFANVENVVNPPPTPVVNNRHKVLSVVLFLLNIANIIPKTKQPNRLTAKVPHGKPCPHTFLMYMESKYLKEPPTKLPEPTINSNFSMLLKLFTVKESIAYTFSHNEITVMDRLKGNELHLFHIRFAIFCQIVLIDKDIDDFGNDVVAVLSFIYLTENTTL